MARTAELILRLVDQVTAPARAVTKALATVNRATAMVQQTARNMRRSATDMAGFSLPVLYVGQDAARQVFEFEKVGNAIEAVTDMLPEQREQLELLAQELNSKFPATNTEIMGAALELAKSGMQYEQIRGSLENTLMLAQAGDFGIQDSSKILIATATAMRMAMDTELEAAQSTGKVADTLAFAANRSLADIPDLGVTLKYVAAAAAATGMTLDELGASVAVLANNGIMGSNAGTGMRYALLQLLSPTKQASDALAKLNIDLGDYVTGAERITATDLVTNLGFDGIDISELGLEDQIQAILDDPAIAKAPAKLVAALSPLITEAMGGEGGIIDSETLAKSLSDSLTVLGTQVDLVGLMRAFRENPDSESQFGRIFGKLHAVKMMALLAGDLDGMIADFEANAAGAALRMSEKRMMGIVGQWYEMTAAIENLYLRIADTGILLDVANVIERIGDALARMSVLNPEMLKFGTYSVLALASLAPLGWALSGVASSAAFLANPITLIAAALGYLAYLNWNGITYFFNSFTRFFSEGLDPAAVQPVLDVFESLKAAATDLTYSMDFSDWGKGAGEGLASVVNRLPEFLTFLGSMRDQAMPIINTVMPLFQQFGSAIGSIANAIVRLTSGAWQSGVAFFTELASGISPETIATLSMIGTTIIDFAKGIWSLVEAAANGIATSEGITKMVHAAAQMGSLTADGLNTVVAGIQSLIDLVKQIMAMDLFETGKQLIQGLIDGMLASIPGLQAVVNTVSSLVNTVAGAGAIIGGGAGSPAGAAGVPTATGPRATNHPSGLPVPGYADGGSYGPGLILTGEKGPELQMASGRGQIFDANETREMLSGKGGKGGGDSYTINVYGGSTEEVMRQLTALIDGRMQRSRSLAMEDRPMME